jgi:Phosphatidylinositol-4-phosphate 5-Kinase
MHSLLVGIALSTTKAKEPTGPQTGPVRRRMARLVVRLLLANRSGRRRCHARTSARRRPNNGGGRLPDDPAVDAGGEFAVLPGLRHGDPALYYLGLIDFLQPFDTRKYVEYQLKALIYDRRSFSCIPPDAYADRFLDFMATHIT